MSQKSSVPQAVSFVSQVLKRDSPGAKRLFVFLRHQHTLFHPTPKLAKYENRKESHPPLLVRAKGRIQRLPRIGQLLEVG